MCTVLLPPGGYPTAVIKYIILYSSSIGTFDQIYCTVSLNKQSVNWDVIICINMARFVNGVII